MGQLQSYYQQKLTQYRADRPHSFISQRTYRFYGMPPPFIYNNKKVNATYNPAAIITPEELEHVVDMMGTRGYDPDRAQCAEQCEDAANKCRLHPKDCQKQKYECEARCTHIYDYNN